MAGSSGSVGVGRQEPASAPASTFTTALKYNVKFYKIFFGQCNTIIKHTKDTAALILRTAAFFQPPITVLGSYYVWFAVVSCGCILSSARS